MLEMELSEDPQRGSILRRAQAVPHCSSFPMTYIRGSFFGVSYPPPTRTPRAHHVFVECLSNIRGYEQIHQALMGVAHGCLI